MKLPCGRPRRANTLINRHLARSICPALTERLTRRRFWPGSTLTHSSTSVTSSFQARGGVRLHRESIAAGERSGGRTNAQIRRRGGKNRATDRRATDARLRNALRTRHRDCDSLERPFVKQRAKIVQTTQQTPTVIGSRRAAIFHAECEPARRPMIRKCADASHYTSATRRGEKYLGEFRE